MDLYVGSSMHMNGKGVTCTAPELKGVKPGTVDLCSDWPSWLVEGKTYVTATCWPDTEFVEGTTTWFCDEIDHAVDRGHQNPKVLRNVTPTPP